jgi:hypothetical protein
MKTIFFSFQPIIDTMSTRIRNAKQLVVICSNQEKLLKGKRQNEVKKKLKLI